MIAFEKTENRVVDLRERIMPPLWADAAGGKTTRNETLKNGVFQTGPNRELAKEMISAIDAAENMIVLSSFLFADKAIEESLHRASERKVSIYFLLAAENKLESQPADDAEFERRVLKEHKAMLNRLAGRVLVRSGHHFHAKFILVDPRSSRAGFLLTANLTEDALRRNQEIGLQLDPDEISALYGLVRWVFWEDAEHELLAQNRMNAVTALGRVSFPDLNGTIHATTRASSDLEKSILSIISSARKRILISNFGWEMGQPVLSLLCERAREGVEVTVITRPRAKPMPALLALAEAGATIVGYRWLHAKAVWSDANESMVMTANFEKRGLTTGFEVGVRIRSARADELRNLLQSWADDAEWWLEPNAAVDDVSGKVMVWHESKLNGAKILPKIELKAPDVTASSADKLDDAQPPEFREPNTPYPTAHELHYSWTVRAPKLSPKAKEIKDESPDPRDPKGKRKIRASYSPPVFREPDGRVVVAIGTEDEIAAAQRLQQQVKAVAIVVKDKRP